MGVPCPKVRKRIRTKKDADKAVDRKESERVKQRSGGRCEVSEVTMLTVDDELHIRIVRCDQRAVHVMHLIGGNGKRGREFRR